MTYEKGRSVKLSMPALLRFSPFGSEADEKLVAQAEEAQQRRDWVAAEALWRRVIERDPTRAPAWIQLGNMCNELKRRDEAIAAFREAGRLDPVLSHAPAGVAGVHERANQWMNAEAAWEETIAMLERDGIPALAQTRQELAHAYCHAALSARHAGSPVRARAILQRARTLVTEISARPEDFALRASVLAPDDQLSTAALLRDFLGILPQDIAASSLKRTPDVVAGGLRQALAEVAPALQHLKGNGRLLRAALDLFEQVRLWNEAQLLAEWLADLYPDTPEYLDRAFRAAAERRNLRHARRIARQYAAQTGDLMLIHQLLRMYEDAVELDRARLLCRFLMRRWKHSRWHVGHHITLTARTRSLAHADRLVRDQVAAGQHDRPVERAYSQAPFYAGSYAEAQRRLEAHLRLHPDDDEARILLGYALANSVSLECAEDHFARVAAETTQAVGPMLGLAHMAMRRRDLPATAERWERITTVHPGETVAFVEMARCAYEMRDQRRALDLCEARLRTYPTDVTMGEFYAWLLAVNGRYADAWKAIATVRRNAGQSWALLELAVQCAGQLGNLEKDWRTILELMPEADTAAASSRLYHVVRNLIVAGRPDLLPDLLQRTRLEPAALPWLHPYLASLGDVVATRTVEQAERRWSFARSQVRSDAAEVLAAMTDVEVDSLLARHPSELPLVHVVGKFEQPRGGSELHALDLAAAIARHARVELWAPESPHPYFAQYKVTGVDVGRGRVPRGGVLVFIGVYFDVASWIAHVRPRRVIFLYNTFEAPSLFQRVDEVFRRTGVRAELMFCADMMQRECSLPGRFEPSPTDLEEFAPATFSRSGQPFTLGRHSRDVVEKHHPEDWRIYQAVAGAGGRSRILGGTCMLSAFPPNGKVHLLPARNTGIAEFLQGLDAFFYRTSTWVEPWGRVVIEAMACGLPVLVHAVGGYAQVIEHEVNGLLFDTTEEAVRLVTRLADEPALRERLGAQARQSVERLLSSAEMRRLTAFYLIDVEPISSERKSMSERTIPAVPIPV